MRARPSPYDFSVPEHAIVARLREKIVDEAKLARVVLTKAELADVPEERQTTPAVFVVYAGYSVAGSGDDAASEFTATLAHRWTIVITVANVSRMREAERRHENAGPIIDAAARALLGWVPCDGFTAFALGSPPPAYYEAGYAYLPFVITTRATACF